MAKRMLVLVSLVVAGMCSVCCLGPDVLGWCANFLGGSCG